MNAVVKKDEFPVMAAPSEAASLLSVISRAASDPNCDIDKMERLMAMHERMIERQAAAEFARDLAEVQTKLPSIKERGEVTGRYKYALWEDINDTIKPILTKYGFALSFRTDFAEGIAITGVLSHRGGHSERTTIKLPADPSGGKNPVQAVASSVSYGKRYTAGALLNLTSYGEDDDGRKAGAQKREPRAGDPQDGVRLVDFPQEQQIVIEQFAAEMNSAADGGNLAGALKIWTDCKLPTEEKTCIWGLLPSHHRSALKRLSKR